MIGPPLRVCRFEARLSKAKRFPQQLVQYCASNRIAAEPEKTRLMLVKLHIPGSHVTHSNGYELDWKVRGNYQLPIERYRMSRLAKI